jgi:hypothetical protein
MFKFKRLAGIFIFVLAFVFIFAGVSQAAHSKFWVEIQDEFGRTLGTEYSNVTVQVLTAGSTTAATIYSNSTGTAKTNSSAWTINSSGVAEWYSSTYSFDLLIMYKGQKYKKASVTVYQHKVRIRADAYPFQEKHMDFGVSAFTGQNGTTPVPLTASSVPNLAVDQRLPVIQWSDGEGNANIAVVSFTVPKDYIDGGAFVGYFMHDGGAVGNAPSVDYGILQTETETTPDETSPNESAVAMTVESDILEAVAMPVTDTLTAGSRVTLHVWRDEVDTGTAALNMYMIRFYYNAGE